MAAELAVTFKGLHDRVLKEAIQTLALFGAAQFLSTDGFPSVDHLMKLGDGWAHYFRNAKKVEEETEEDRKQAAWAALLHRYGYGNTSSFDAGIGHAVQRGYFDHI